MKRSVKPKQRAADADRGPPSWLPGVGLGVSCVILIALRLHAFDLPLENDECNYAYIGGRLLAGDRLYVDVWDHQPFGVFALFAGVIAVLGDAPEVFRWLSTAFSLVSLAFVFAIVRRVTGPAAAVSASVLFALASSDPGTAGEGCNREIYMVTLILAAWYMALRGQGRLGGWTFAAGAALGVASTIKTIVAVQWVFLALWVAVVAWREGSRDGRLRSVAGSLACLAAGPFLLWAVSFGYFAATDRWSEFVDAVFLFNLSYSGGSEGFFQRFAGFFAPQGHPFVFDSALPVWLAGGVATIWLAFHTIVRRTRDGAAILSLLVGSYIAVCLPARFWPHYYYLLIPVLILVLSIAIGSLLRSLHERNSFTPRTFRAVSAAALSLVPVALLVTEYREYLGQPPFGITVTRYNSRDFWGRAQGENVRRVTSPDDTIFVFGNDAEIYYYSRRRCASRFTMITGVQTGYADVDRRRAQLLADLEARLPRVIIVLFDERHPWDSWYAFLRRYYGEAVGWDLHDRRGDPIMLVYARKDQPIESINWDWDRSEVGGWFLGEKR